MIFRFRHFYSGSWGLSLEVGILESISLSISMKNSSKYPNKKPVIIPEANFPSAFLDSDDDDETSMSSSEIDGFA